MTIQQMLQIMRTLSALESWAWAVKEPIPAWLTEQVGESVAMLEKAILEGVKE
jgi:hypothetical protein